MSFIAIYVLVRSQNLTYICHIENVVRERDTLGTGLLKHRLNKPWETHVETTSGHLSRLQLIKEKLPRALVKEKEKLFVVPHLLMPRLTYFC
jgi:hypothetical protein